MLVRKAEGDYYPIEKVPKDKDTLEGFIWKPKERPASKEEIIPSLRRTKKPSVNQKRAAVPEKKTSVTDKAKTKK
jgi:hypothetical protein